MPSRLLAALQLGMIEYLTTVQRVPNGIGAGGCQRLDERCSQITAETKPHAGAFGAGQHPRSSPPPARFRRAKRVSHRDLHGEEAVRCASPRQSPASA